MRVVTKSSVLAAVFLGMFVASARAEEILSVKIPFPFVVDQKEYPAGQYEIRTSDDSAEVIWIEGTTNRSAAVTLTVPTEGRDPAGAEPALVFTRSENTYRLSQIWDSRSTGHELTPPSGARHVGRSARLSGDLETVTIAAQSK